MTSEEIKSLETGDILCRMNGMSIPDIIIIDNPCIPRRRTHRFMVSYKKYNILESGTVSDKTFQMMSESLYDFDKLDEMVIVRVKRIHEKLQKEAEMYADLVEDLQSLI